MSGKDYAVFEGVREESTGQTCPKCGGTNAVRSECNDDTVLLDCPCGYHELDGRPFKLDYTSADRVLNRFIVAMLVAAAIVGVAMGGYVMGWWGLGVPLW